MFSRVFVALSYCLECDPPVTSLFAWQSLSAEHEAGRNVEVSYVTRILYKILRRPTRCTIGTNKDEVQLVEGYNIDVYVHQGR